MSLRLRRSLRLLPGVRINIGKTGMSLSAGGRGATVNVSKRGVYGTAGIPGTGVSIRERLVAPSSSGGRTSIRPWIVVVAIVVVGIACAVLKGS
jgi:hypothetical protein